LIQPSIASHRTCAVNTRRALGFHFRIRIFL